MSFLIYFLPPTQYILHLYRSPSKPCSHHQVMFSPPYHLLNLQPCFYPQATLSPPSHALTPKPCSYPQAILLPPSHVLTPTPCSYPQAKLGNENMLTRNLALGYKLGNENMLTRNLALGYKLGLRMRAWLWGKGVARK